jgi:Fe2+ transport system protein FeoA
MDAIRTAADLKVGESMVLETVNPFSPLCSKLTQMGFLPNKTLRLLRTSWAGETMYIQLGTQFIALRRTEAAQLEAQVGAQLAAQFFTQ